MFSLIFSAWALFLLRSGALRRRKGSVSLHIVLLQIIVKHWCKQLLEETICSAQHVVLMVLQNPGAILHVLEYHQLAPYLLNVYIYTNTEYSCNHHHPLGLVLSGPLAKRMKY